MKENLTSAPVLIILESNVEMTVFTEAFGIGLEAVVM